jgi:hypothetical protein
VAGLLAGPFSFTGLGDRGTSRLAASGGRRTTRGRSGRRFGRALVTVQTTLALILLAGAALLTRSYRALGAIDPGFTTDGVLSARVTPVDGRYPDDTSRSGFYADIEDRIGAVPGVLGVALTYVPPGVGAGTEQPFAIAGRAPTQGSWPTVVWRPVSDSYFGVLDIPLLRGQSLDGMALLAIFAVASLLLAAAGIYGIVAHSVGQRLREMGIRIALGARAADVMRHVVGERASFAGLGVAAGLIIVAALGNVLDALTPVRAGVTPRESRPPQWLLRWWRSRLQMSRRGAQARRTRSTRYDNTSRRRANDSLRSFGGCCGMSGHSCPCGCSLGCGPG